MNKKNIISFSKEDVAGLLRVGNIKAARSVYNQIRSSLSSELFSRGEFEPAMRIVNPLPEDFNWALYIRGLIEHDVTNVAPEEVRIIQHSANPKRGMFSLPLKKRVAVSDLKDFGAVSLLEQVEYEDDKSLIEQLGIPILDFSDQGGKFTIPTVTPGLASAYYLDGDTIDGINGSDPSFPSQANIDPKMNVAQIIIGRKVLKSTSPLIGQMIQHILDLSIANGRFNAMLYGSGLLGNPAGAYSFKGTTLNVIDGHSLGKTGCDELERLVDQSEAPPDNRFYLVGPNTAKVLKSRPSSPAGGDKMLLQDNKLNGTPCIISKRITEGHVWYGRFSTTVITEFQKEYLVNPFTDTTGDIHITAFSFEDVVIRNINRIALAENVD